MTTKSRAPKPATRRKQAPAAPTPERVHLVRAHEHQGEKLPAGAAITVHPAIAQWLRAVGAVSPKITTEKD
mgnify:CR=1 FL=1